MIRRRGTYQRPLVDYHPPAPIVEPTITPGRVLFLLACTAIAMAGVALASALLFTAVHGG